ncbi:hypothetical protein BESB_047330 [Besnoitia besnoiti]|uniref:Ppg3 n=1 Tax=Besnoitia besnoiti TaxID=94643 RepID=A0A2A9MJW1_BESBE|nr:hypothetical protein BESB_047330 [Besnoitia besnoiti]PFH36541.1 hypothetical protein BESB_047330 [Besnoitia besnoiti]
MVLVRSPRRGPAASRVSPSSSPSRIPRPPFACATHGSSRASEQGSPHASTSTRAPETTGTRLEFELTSSADAAAAAPPSSSVLGARRAAANKVSGIPLPRLSALGSRGEDERSERAEKSRRRDGEEPTAPEDSLAHRRGLGRDASSAAPSSLSSRRSLRPEAPLFGAPESLPPDASIGRSSGSPSAAATASPSRTAAADLAATASSREGVDSSLAASSPSKRLRKEEDFVYSFLSGLRGREAETSSPRSAPRPSVGDQLGTAVSESSGSRRDFEPPSRDPLASPPPPVSAAGLPQGALPPREAPRSVADADALATEAAPPPSSLRRLSLRAPREGAESEAASASLRRRVNDGREAEKRRVEELEGLAQMLPASEALRDYMQQAAEGARGSRDRDDARPRFAVPKSADEFRAQWRPLVDATVKKLCDMTDEEKQAPFPCGVSSGVVPDEEPARRQGRASRLFRWAKAFRSAPLFSRIRSPLPVFSSSQVTRYIMLEGRMLRAAHRAAASLASRRTKAVAFNSETREVFLEEEQLYEASEREFEVVQRVAQDQAGGQEKLEKRLKDTQRKREQAEVYRHQVHKKMAALSFTRQKKLRLFEALEAAKKESFSKERSLQAVYQLLQFTTRFKVNKVEGGLVTGALVPEQQSALFPQLAKTTKNAKRAIQNGLRAAGEDEDLPGQEAAAEPAILTLDCDKENEGGRDADVLWGLIEEALGIADVPVPQLLKAARVE